MDKRKGTFKWIFSYLWKYKVRFIFSLLTGFLAAASIFFVLIQMEAVFEPLEGEKTTYHELKIKRENNLILLPIHYTKDRKENLKKGDKIIEVVTPSLGKLDKQKLLEKIPLSVKEWIEKKANISLQEEENLSKILMFLTVFFLILAVFLKSVFFYINNYLLSWLSLRIEADIRKNIVSSILKKPMSFYHKNSIGELISRSHNDVVRISSTISPLIISFTRTPIEFLAIFSFLIYKSFTSNLGIVILILTLIAPLILIPIFFLGRYIKRYIKRSLIKIASITSTMQEFFSCIKLIKTSNMVNKEIEHFGRENNLYFKSKKKISRFSLALNPFTEAFAVTILAIFLFYCYLQNINISSVLVICLAIQFAYGPIKKLSQAHIQILNLKESAFRIRQYLEKPFFEQETDKVALEKKSFNKQIEFKNISFCYTDKDSILENINFTINKGQFIAFVGSVGSGKTTIINLLCRFYKPSEGEILIDGKNINDISLHSYYNLFSFVDQVNILFNNSIRHNLLYGVNDYNEKLFNQIAKICGIDLIIKNKSEGYDFHVGGSGQLLSGGQKQRITIARALIKNSPIIVLDEATSSLDNITEKKLQEAIDSLSKDKTIIAIAHRLSTIKKADVIYVLNKGKIVEVGDHNSLIKTSTLYSSMWEHYQ